MHLYLDDVKEETAYKNIKELKEFGLHITATASKKVSSRIMDLVDVILYDKENLLLTKDYGEPSYTFYWFENANFRLEFARKERQPHSLAVLRSMVKGCEIAKMKGFTHVIRIEFDDLLSERSVNFLLEQARKMEEDMLFFKNEYGYSQDISVHTILYRPEEFLRMFGDIMCEDDYSRHLKELDVNRSISLEEFICLTLDKRKANTKYLDGTKMESILVDSVFNLHSSPSSLVGGCLVDVMKCDNGSSYFSYVCYENYGSKITLEQRLANGGLIKNQWEASPMNWAYIPIDKGSVKVDILIDENLYASYDILNGNVTGDHRSTIAFK